MGQCPWPHRGPPLLIYPLSKNEDCVVFLILLRKLNCGKKFNTHLGCDVNTTMHKMVFFPHTIVIYTAARTNVIYKDALMNKKFNLIFHQFFGEYFLRRKIQKTTIFFSTMRSNWAGGVL